MTVFRDIRFAWRLLARNPTFAAAAILVIALGIGATTSVFTVVRGVLLRPLPYPDPDRLVLLRADSGRGARTAELTGQEYDALHARADLFDGLTTIVGVDANLTGVDDMEALPAASISDDFFRVLGVTPALGRPLSVRDDMGRDHVSGFAISYELWQRRWKGDRSLVGRQVEVNNYLATVVAVMPPQFEIYLGPGTNVPRHIDVFFPFDPREAGPTTPSYPAVGRLHASNTIASVQTALDVFAPWFVADHPADYKTGGVRLTAVRLADDVVHDVKPALVALTGAVAFVLLVACANLTNLLLARACARTRELSVRLAIGASRRDLIQQLTIESVVLAGIGGFGGLLVASWGIDGLMRLAPAGLPRPDQIHIDGGIVAFALAVSFAASLLFGLVPAWHATRPDVVATMKEDPASRSRVTRGLLVAGQLALCVMLLVGAGLLARSFVALRQAPLGFRADRALVMKVQLTFRNFRETPSRLAFYDRAAAAVRALPGVEGVGFASPAPLDGLTVYRRVALDGSSPEIATYQPTALPGYFDVAGIRVREGRDFTASDETTRDRTPIIVDDWLARQMFGGGPAVGRRVLLSPNGISEQWAEIVGVVDHARAQDVRIDGLPQIYVSFSHRPMLNAQMIVRTSGDPAALATAARRAVERLGPGRPVTRIATLGSLVDAGRADTRFALFVLTAFAGVALLLTAIGVYGVVAYATARRTREIAVRLALGAAARDIILLVVREGSAWIVLGLVAGLAGARVLSTFLAALLVHVTAADPATFLSVAALLAAVAIVASAVPAIRAVRIDPMLSLRAE
ncbi:MAG TPA: ABC transporter permease [Vicinamibacterales bacterium]|nr:ABC transporter permease [Vicinamibacterales bacterium]